MTTLSEDTKTFWEYCKVMRHHPDSYERLLARTGGLKILAEKTQYDKLRRVIYNEQERETRVANRSEENRTK